MPQPVHRPAVFLLPSVQLSALMTGETRIPSRQSFVITSPKLARRRECSVTSAIDRPPVRIYGVSIARLSFRRSYPVRTRLIPMRQRRRTLRGQLLSPLSNGIPRRETERICRPQQIWAQSALRLRTDKHCSILFAIRVFVLRGF